MVEGEHTHIAEIYPTHTNTPTHTDVSVCVTHPHTHIHHTHAHVHSWYSLWSKSGNAGYRWNEATVFAAGSGHSFVRFTYV